MTEAELKRLNDMAGTIQRLKAITNGLTLGGAVQVDTPTGMKSLPCGLVDEFREWIEGKLEEAEEQFRKA